MTSSDNSPVWSNMDGDIAMLREPADVDLVAAGREWLASGGIHPADATVIRKLVDALERVQNKLASQKPHATFLAHVSEKYGFTVKELTWRVEAENGWESGDPGYEWAVIRAVTQMRKAREENK